MKVTFKLIGVSALALTVALCGCSKLSGVLYKKDINTMQMNGRKLIQGIMQANIEREGKLGSVWPRTYREGDSNVEDISEKSFKSAAEYFSALFDMEHYGTSEWDPVVDGDLLSTLGKNAVVDGKINPDGLDWCIAANVDYSTLDFIPVLVSANVNPALLPCDKFDGMTDRRLPIGPISGAERSMFGDSAIVLVRKSGAAESFMEKYFRLNLVFNRQGFDNSNLEHPIVWLTPTGIAK